MFCLHVFSSFDFHGPSTVIHQRCLPVVLIQFVELFDLFTMQKDIVANIKCNKKSLYGVWVIPFVLKM